ncbi:MAG: hypothetical protein NT160_03965 [Actinobacteria bacterium]|nr:hypothetical protein [Actinomycetota bacterium]
MSEVQAERLVSDMRGVRYGEVLAVYKREEKFEAEVFGTQLLNDCPPELWDPLNAADIAADMGALVVKLNGPRYWLVDGFGTKVEVVEPVMREFSGLLMRRIAVLDLGTNPSQVSYIDRKVNRGAIFFLDAGKPVYELVNPDGLAYVMQAYCTGVDSALSQADLPTLGERLALPEGWTYRTRILDEEMVIDTSATLATVLQDELENSYTLPF